MNNKILFVDDEENILASFKRNLRKNFNIVTATSGAEGLNLIKNNGEFSVVVSDMQMPNMKGSEFLKEVSHISPDSVRILLTGYANIENAIAAVNEGRIFRFLTKPCSNDVLINALNEGTKQYRLITAEKELLEKTLKNSIEVLTSILSMVNPTAFGRASRVRRYVIQIGQQLKLKNLWQLEMAAMLSQIGFVTLPPHILEKVYTREMLNEKEQRMFAEHPSIGASLIEKIPRMKTISEIIQKQNTDYKDHEKPAALSTEQKFVTLCAQILKVVIGFDELVFQGASKTSAIAMLKRDAQRYNPRITDLLEYVRISEKERQSKSVYLAELKPNMISQSNISSVQGKILVARNIELTEPLIKRLQAYDKTVGVTQPVKVLI
jgi:response regulator RpfG family c-di-GMP phosphodiesterase